MTKAANAAEAWRMRKPYHRLLVWQRAHQFAKDIYAVTAGFSKTEQFGLTAQLRRAAISVPANIVEGQAKPTKNDFRRYLAIAAGSLAECEYYLELACELGFLSADAYARLDHNRGEVSLLLNRFIRSLH
mgnify:FL=1